MTTIHSLRRRALGAWRAIFAPRFAGLEGLDARTLADIGIDRSEIASIGAEARALRSGIESTRRRIAVGLHHG